MGTTLSHGYYLPADNDTGDVWFPNMAANITLLNNHTHNGTDGAYLAITTQSILAANWGNPTNGTYSQTITIPSSPTGLTYDTCTVMFKLSTGQIIYPSVVRVNASSYTIYTIDNSQTYTAIYR